MANIRSWYALMVSKLLPMCCQYDHSWVIKRGCDICLYRCCIPVYILQDIMHLYAVLTNGEVHTHSDWQSYLPKHLVHGQSALWAQKTISGLLQATTTSRYMSL